MQLTLERLSSVLRDDKELSYKLFGFSGRITVRVGDIDADLVATDGRIESVGASTGDAARLEVVIPEDVFTDSLRTPPVPGTEALGLAAARGAIVRGDIVADVAPYSGATARIYQLARLAAGAPGEVPAPASPTGQLFAETDTAVGRYVYVTSRGVTYRVYYEESGSGSETLLLQHTAGCDSRQWRHQLADPEFQSRFRLIAYDLPHHGRSLPPTGERWWESPFQHEPEWYWDFVVALVDALGLEHPHFMGCSVGGQLALDLGAYRSEHFGAFFALNGSLKSLLPADAATAFNNLSRDTRVSTEIYSVGCFGATSPMGPEPFRREIYWIYSSNAQGVYAGDNDYYTNGHNLTRGNPNFDTDRHPVYCIAGEYDPVANDETVGGPAVAAMFPGVRAEVLSGQSHFAPTDDPIGFRDAVLPLLERGVAEFRAAHTASSAKA